MIEYHQTNPLMESSLTGLQSAINGFTAAQLVLLLVQSLKVVELENVIRSAGETGLVSAP